MCRESCQRSVLDARRHNFSTYRSLFSWVLLDDSSASVGKALGGLAVSLCLQKHIDHLSVLINSSPQILPLTADLHEYFINEKNIAETLVPTLQPAGILRSKLVTPQTNSFITDGNSTFSQQIVDISMTEVKSIIEPNRVLNKFSWKSVAPILRVRCTHTTIVT